MDDEEVEVHGTNSTLFEGAQDRIGGGLGIEIGDHYQHEKYDQSFIPHSEHQSTSIIYQDNIIATTSSNTQISPSNEYQLIYQETNAPETTTPTESEKMTTSAPGSASQSGTGTGSASPSRSWSSNSSRSEQSGGSRSNESREDQEEEEEVEEGIVGAGSSNISTKLPSTSSSSTSTTKVNNRPELSDPGGDKSSDDDDEMLTAESSKEEEELPEKIPVHPTVLDKAIEELIELFAEEVSFETAIEVGRDLRFGQLDLLGVLDEVPEELKIVDQPGLDVFGQPIASKSKINYECECPKCKRTIVAARFAPHLEKCMGMGRNSSRIASRRIANSASGGSGGNSKEEKSSSQGSSSNGTAVQISDLGLGSDEDNIDEDEDDDEEWTMEKKKSKKSKEKPSSKKKGAVNRLKADVTTKTLPSSKSKSGSPSMSLAVSPENTAMVLTTTTEEDFNPHSQHSMYPQ